MTDNKHRAKLPENKPDIKLSGRNTKLINGWGKTKGMSTILDPSGTPVLTQKKLFQAVWNHFRQNWSKWLSVLAFAVAAWSASTAHLARDQSRILA